MLVLGLGATVFLGTFQPPMRKDNSQQGQKSQGPDMQACALRTEIPWIAEPQNLGKLAVMSCPEPRHL